MIAITGAGEYLDTIRPYDKVLLDKLDQEPYVLSFPTAAGLESEERIQYWLNLADEHFEKLGFELIHPRDADWGESDPEII